MDLKAKVDEVVTKIKSDKDIQAKFEKDPVAVVEELTGMDLPNDQVNQLIDGIKAKLKLDKAGDMLGGMFGKK